MPSFTSRDDLTQQNISEIQAIFTDVELPNEQRADLMSAAVSMIYGQKFDSIYAQWKAFQKVLSILVQGGLVQDAKESRPASRRKREREDFAE